MNKIICPNYTISPRKQYNTDLLHFSYAKESLAYKNDSDGIDFFRRDRVVISLFTSSVRTYHSKKTPQVSVFHVMVDKGDIETV